MATKKKRPAGGAKLSRSKVVSHRLDPRLHFGAEIAAAKCRRTLSSFTEWAIEEALKQVNVGNKGETAYKIMEDAWDIEEGYRFYEYARKCSKLLTPEQEKLWKVIKEASEVHSHCLEIYANSELKYEPPDWQWERVVNKFFEDFKKCAEGKLDEGKLYRKIDDHMEIIFRG
jgi:hypothetical protein